LYFTDRHSYIEGEAGGRRYRGIRKRGFPHIGRKQAHLFPKALVMDFLSSNDSELTWGGSPLSRRRSTKMTPRYGSLLAFAFVLVLAPSLRPQTAPGPQTAGSTKTVVASNPQNPVDTSVPAAGPNGSAPQDPPRFSPAEAFNDRLPKWLRFDGEYRARLEQGLSGKLFQPNDSDTYFLNRFLFGVTVRPSTWLTFRAEGQDARAFSKNPPETSGFY